MSARTNALARSLVTTLVLVAGAVTWSVLDRPVRPAPAIARPASPASARVPLVVAPTAAELIVRPGLALTPPQRARLEALAADWQREIAPLESELRAAADEFSRYMADAERAGRARLDDVRRHSLGIGELSAALRLRRAHHGESALAVLTEAQKNDIRGGAR